MNLELNLESTPEAPAGRAAELVARLQAAGYRLTPQRLALVNLLTRDDTHPSADQIFARLRAKYPTVSLATVYNTLDMLVELGEALTLDLSEGCTRYDVRRPSAHPHVVCRTCGLVADLEVDGLADFVDEARTTSTFGDLQPRIYFDGVCPTCANASRQPRGK
jgi:Fur family peroxide stress response transcriptional regulator